MRPLTFTVEAADDGRTLKQLLLSRVRLSEGAMRRLKFQDGILLDGAPAHVTRCVRAGQTVTLLLPGDDPGWTVSRPDALCVRYEDAHLLVVDKPAPLPTLPSAHQTGETLEDRARAYYGDPPGFLFRPVSRLDKGTSGLLVCARGAHEQKLLSERLHTDAFVREYLAVVAGRPPQERGVVDAPIAHAPGETVRRCVAAEGKPARTHYALLAAHGDFSLLRLRLETGRTHQIRVHMASLGCPVAGDFLYGREDARLPGRFALHSAHVSLLHPLTGARIEISSTLPEALAALLH